jgi:hypothetical protein
VLSVGSDDEVSPDDVPPLERKRRLLHSDRSMVGRPPSMGQQVPKMATASWPDAMVVASSVVAPGESSGGEPVASAVEAATMEAAAEKETADVATTKKAPNDTVAVKGR